MSVLYLSIIRVGLKIALVSGSKSSVRILGFPSVYRSAAYCISLFSVAKIVLEAVA